MKRHSLWAHNLFKGEIEDGEHTDVSDGNGLPYAATAVSM